MMMMMLMPVKLRMSTTPVACCNEYALSVINIAPRIIAMSARFQKARSFQSATTVNLRASHALYCTWTICPNECSNIAMHESYTLDSTIKFFFKINFFRLFFFLTHNLCMYYL